MDKDIVEKISMSIVAILLSIMVFIMVKQDNEINKQREIAIKKKWETWVTYRDKNCKLIEKLYGVNVPGTKMVSTDNANKYECKNGISYTIFESKDNGNGGLNSIPTI